MRIEPGGDDVVEHAARVSDPEAAWLDASDSRRTDDSDPLLTCLFDELAGAVLRDSL